MAQRTKSATHSRRHHRIATGGDRRCLCGDGELGSGGDISTSPSEGLDEGSH